MRLLIYTHGKTGSTALAYSVLARLPDHRLIFEPPSLDIIPDEQNLVVKYISPNWAKDQQDVAGYDLVIVLVRHPFDVLISAVMYFPFTARDFLDNRRMNEFYRLLQQLEAHDVNVSMRTVWEWLIELRPDYPLTWSILHQFERLRFAIASMKDHVLTKYEDACDAGIEPDNGKLWFPISTQTTIASAFEHVERSKGAGGWRNWFSTEDCRYFAGIPEIRRYARTCGYDLNVPVAAVQARDARVGSEYVRRLVDGQRKRFNVPPFAPGNRNAEDVPPKLLDALTLRLDLRDNQKAFETALCACVEQPRHPAALLELGIGALLNRFTAAAQTVLSQAVSLCPNNSIAWNYLAESYRATGQLQEAVKAAREAIRLEPDSADHNQLLGSVLNRLGRWAEAEKHLRFAVESPGGVETFKWALIRNLFEQQKYEEALDILQKAQRALGHSAEYDRLRQLILLKIESPRGATPVVDGSQDQSRARTVMLVPDKMLGSEVG